MIEDEHDLAEIYSLQMKMCDIDVTVAPSGAEALEILKKGKFDLVLLDLFMPNVDGFEVLKKLRNEIGFKGCPVYAWSNLTQKKQIALAMKCGADGFLIKSDYTPKGLVDKVSEIIKKK